FGPASSPKPSRSTSPRITGYTLPPVIRYGSDSKAPARKTNSSHVVVGNRRVERLVGLAQVLDQPGLPDAADHVAEPGATVGGQVALRRRVGTAIHARIDVGDPVQGDQAGLRVRQVAGPRVRPGGREQRQPEDGVTAVPGEPVVVVRDEGPLVAVLVDPAVAVVDAPVRPLLRVPDVDQVLRIAELPVEVAVLVQRRGVERGEVVG